MKLKSQQRQWDYLGRTDPLWAILTDPARKGGGWNQDEFFATGRAEIAELMGRLSADGLVPPRRAALDFGCGVGRLTQALAEYFDEVTGLDIAPAMLERARAWNRHGDRCRYLLNARNNLSLLPKASFDLVYSRITLQHLPPRHIRRYLAEFLRVLRPHGLLVFQLPDEHRRRRHRLVSLLYRFTARRLLNRRDLMDMYGLPRNEVVALLESHGGRVVRVDEDRAAGPQWVSWRYYVQRTD